MTTVSKVLVCVFLFLLGWMTGSSGHHHFLVWLLEIGFAIYFGIRSGLFTKNT